MYEVATFIFLALLAITFIVTWKYWLGTVLSLIVILYLIELGSDDRFPVLTYLIDGLSKLKFI